MDLPVYFDIHTPADEDTIQRHIEHALSLNLPEADGEPLLSLTIIANGPSAKDAPLEGLTLAVNGALKLFLDQNKAPTYWACCDPQEKVADFIPDTPPIETVYLVASKCHPKVFEKLRGRAVLLWHISDYPPPSPLRAVRCASTITLCIMALMRKRGFRQFEVYGWDGCYGHSDDGIHHHADEAPIQDYPEDALTLIVGAQQIDGEMVGGKSFMTSRSWAAEAQDAVTQLHHADYQVNIHGDSMIKAIIESRTS